MVLKNLELVALRVDVLHLDPDAGKDFNLGPATASVFQGKNGSLWLVSNWHVFTCRRPNSPSSSTVSVTPTHLRMRYHCWDKSKSGRDPNKRTITPQKVYTDTIRINTPDGQSPLWIEDPFRSMGVDIAAIKVELPLDSAILHCNKLSSGTGHANHISQSVTIVGFPEGLTGASEALPIAKSGYVATNPLIGHRGHDRFLIDARTYKGMSGSPVYLTSVGYDTILLGIYSGRLFAPDKTETELGYCWRVDRIEHMLDDFQVESRLWSKLSDFAGAQSREDSMTLPKA